MKKIFLFILCVFLPLEIWADSYTSLWKKVSEAQQKDLPKTQLLWLEKIVDKAQVSHDYGQLIKAEMMTVQAQAAIAPDSLAPALARLEAKQAAATTPALKGVYACAIGKAYQNSFAVQDADEKSRQWFKTALSQPEALAQEKSTNYAPLLDVGLDSKIFYDDLLHVIGIEADDYRTLYNYYSTHGNRPAACITALHLLEKANHGNEHVAKRSHYLQRIDSLLRTYRDLREAGEVAIARYNFLNQCEDVSAEDKYNFINYALSHWGTWPRMNVLRNAQLDLQRPEFNINIGCGLFLPDRPRLVRINSIRNINELYVKVYRLRLNGDTQLDPTKDKDYEKLKNLMFSGEVQAVTRRYVGQPVWKECQDSITLTGMPVGVYLIEASTDNADVKPQRQLLRVSNLFVMRQALPQNRMRFVVTDATSGKPITGAHLRIYNYKNTYNEDISTEDLTTDKNGEATFSHGKRAPKGVYPYTDNDKACAVFDAWGNYYYYKDVNTNHKADIFTDRSMYRPGQTVHATTIVYDVNNSKLQASPRAGLSIKFTLRDANFKVVKELDAMTDDYGTAAVEFTLPQQGLTGTYTIRTQQGGYARIQVEQYKRPTYQVEFDAYQKAYQAGDTLRVQGKAMMFSGVPVQGGKVVYSVKRRPAFWYYWGRDDRQEDILTDSTTTQDNGYFTVLMPMSYPDDADTSRPLYYNVSVTARVTDGSGETHEGSFSLPLSNRRSLLSTTLPEKIQRDSLKQIIITRQNAAGEQVAGVVSYRFDEDEWKSVEANKTFPLDMKLPSGRHQLLAVCQGDTLKKEFIVFSMTDKKPVIETNDWFYISDNAFRQDGKPVYIQLGSTEEDLTVFYTLLSGNKLLEQGHRTLSNEVVTRMIEYKPEYGNGITLTLGWVRRGKLHSHRVSLRRPVPDNKLSLTWKTFRDRLTPGQKEEWTLQVNRPDGKAAVAQVLASMYDKSLDQILKHSWSFNYNYSLPLPNTTWLADEDWAIGLYGFQPEKAFTTHELDFTHFDTSLFSFLGTQDQVIIAYGRGHKRLAPMMMQAAKVAGANMLANDSAVPAAETLADTKQHDSEEKQKSTDNVSLRENFEETAFSCPQLETGHNGQVSFKFTLPESVTTWHFMALAHDKAMNYGMLSADAVAKKTVMVQPHLPRFIRQGDRATVSARIFNTSDRSISGTARVQLVNPESEKVVMELSSPFTVEAGKNSTVDFLLQGNQLESLPESSTLFIIKVLAEGRGFSDGEQHWLPLLPSDEWVTTTVPFTQNGAGVKSLDLSGLFPSTDKRNRLTVEYTNHPAWLMIQALPTVANPCQNNAISLASALYANTLSHQILSASPRIGQTIKLWKAEKGSEYSLLSSLEKDEELKSLVLSETPWVADADRESSQKQMLTNYLNASNVSYRLDKFTHQLIKLHNGDGSFSWWPGMKGNAYVTLSVVEILSRLKSLMGSLSPKLNDIIAQSQSYLDKQLADEVTRLKQDEKKGIKHLMPSDFTCHYLYVNALNQRKATADITYMVRLLEQQPSDLTIYGKANSAVILSQYGKVSIACQYLQSLREYTVYREEMGRYFDTHRALYSWFDYRIPTQVAAIEALKRLTPTDTLTISEMERWLLQAKHTQAWDTPINSVDAVHAFLTDSKGEVDMTKLGQGEEARLSIDGKTLKMPKATAGIGYVKMTLSPAGQVKTFAAEKASEGTSWGAVYAQYWQKATEVKSQSSGLKVKRELISAATQKPLTEGTSLRKGDKIIVRITITADRDYDFVQVQDKRAACLEPASQLSGYQWGYYCAPRDNETDFYFDQLPKGTHKVETAYYVDREGTYESGICTAQCAYSPEFSGREAAHVVKVE